MKQNIAIITGASEGIGAALTKLLIKHNWKVIGLSRNLEKLKLMQNSLFQKKDYLKIYACDVQDFSKLKSIAKKNSPADLLFLNAGIYNPIDASQNNIEDYKQHLNINYLGVINTYEAFLPKMITTLFVEANEISNAVKLLNTFKSHFPDRIESFPEKRLAFVSPPLDCIKLILPLISPSNSE